MASHQANKRIRACFESPFKLSGAFWFGRKKDDNKLERLSKKDVKKV
jgi:hypothetical protein